MPSAASIGCITIDAALPRPRVRTSLRATHDARRRNPCRLDWLCTAHEAATSWWWLCYGWHWKTTTESNHSSFSCTCDKLHRIHQYSRHRLTWDCVPAAVVKRPAKRKATSVDRPVRLKNDQHGRTGRRDSSGLSADFAQDWRAFCRAVVEFDVIPTGVTIPFQLHLVKAYRYRLQHHIVRVVMGTTIFHRCFFSGSGCSLSRQPKLILF